jgi:hypothetical protein
MFKTGAMFEYTNFLDRYQCRGSIKEFDTRSSENKRWKFARLVEDQWIHLLIPFQQFHHSAVSLRVLLTVVC